MSTATLIRLKTVARWIVIASALTVGAALVLEYGYGYAPCRLCLTERLPYYAAVLLGLIALFVPERLARLTLAAAALGLICGAGIGVYHAGAEWKFWPGPSGCGGESANPSEIGVFLSALQTIKLTDCSVAAMRVLGISLAGWNVLVALALSSFAGMVAVRA